MKKTPMMKKVLFSLLILLSALFLLEVRAEGLRTWVNEGYETLFASPTTTPSKEYKSMEFWWDGELLCRMPSSEIPFCLVIKDVPEGEYDLECVMIKENGRRDTLKKEVLLIRPTSKP